MKTVIECLEERGFIDAITSEDLKEKIKIPLKGYIGFDPTADSLHLGNLVGLVALVWFQRFGHTPVLLLGGGTGKIGDPSGKNQERPLLEEELITANVKAIEKQVRRFFDFSKNPPIILNNDSWLSKYSLIEFLRDVGKYFRLGPMLAKESVRSRLHSEEGLSFTEFSYQVLQGYDFYYLFKNHGVTLQVGGSDQWGNITAGIELTRKLEKTSLFGLTHPLLVRSDGAKFGKSEGGAIWLDPAKTSPFQFYQYLVQISDEDVIKLMRMLTFIEIEEIREYEKRIKEGTHVPNEAQRRLAEELTQFVHGEEGLKAALRVTKETAPGATATLDPTTFEEMRFDMPYLELSEKEVLQGTFLDLLSKTPLVSSKGEAARLVKSGGAYLNNEKVLEGRKVIEKEDLIGEKYLLIGAGKKKKLLIEVKK